jgi:DNA polymerase/3'-5' exonuclease PolX
MIIDQGLANSSTARGATNRVIAANLREYSDLLEEQGSDGFRVSAYRRAAQTVETATKPLIEVLGEEGIEGIERFPGIGRSIAAAIVEMLRQGRWSQLDRLRGTLDPETLFRTVPGIGRKLARAIHETLQVETLEGLEVAAWDGTLADVQGVGERRLQMIRVALGDRLGKRRISRRQVRRAPPLSLLLKLDEEYRESASRRALKKIAPRRFNPTGKAWLPVMHADRERWSFTLLFSNTQRAHELNRTRDWVVIYFQRDSEEESQCTVVTEHSGPLAGKRVVRGREEECARHYQSAI